MGKQGKAMLASAFALILAGAAVAGDDDKERERANPVAERGERQQDRQERRVDRRIDRETDQATDRVVDRAMDRLFRR